MKQTLPLISFIVACITSCVTVNVQADTPAASIDIAPFALPNCPPGEIWCEQPRDILTLKVEFNSPPPNEIALSYRQKYWPAKRLEIMETAGYPFSFGWAEQDDWFTSQWKNAAIHISPADQPNSVWIEFQNLSAESFPDFNPKENHYDVNYRRTLALKIETPSPDVIRQIAVFTVSPVEYTTLNVRFDIQKKSFEKSLRLTGYNTILESPFSLDRANCKRDTFPITVRRFKPLHKYSGDDSLLLFHIDDDLFTVSLTSLDNEGPVWFPEKGFFITNADNPIAFEDYQNQFRDEKTIADRVLTRTDFPKEQSRFESYVKQPRPHAADYAIGCALASQKFIINSYGDLLMPKRLFKRECIGGKGLGRLKMNMEDADKHNNGARLTFGKTSTRNLDAWRISARFADPEPVLIYNIRAQRRGIVLEQKFLAVPLLTSINDNWAVDDPMVALVRLRFENKTNHPESVEFPLTYSQIHTPLCDPLTLRNNQILSPFEGKDYLRFAVQTDMQLSAEGNQVVLRQTLSPGQSCLAVVKVPFLTLESADEFRALDALDFEKSCPEVTAYWHRTSDRGAVLQTPEPELEALHASHLSHVLMSDFARPAEPELINTCVGTPCYADYPNESCMIIHDLDERGLHDDARRRLAVWIKYQSTKALTGNFTDQNGLFQGSGGFEQGYYNQNHGFVMWCLAEHYFFTRDEAWLQSIAQNLLDAADWIVRQRQQTMKPLPHSRGWEYGFFPAGSLEDVQDYCYWLATNVLTWRGMEWTARALEDIQHPQAARIRKESDAFKTDLLKGFEISRQHSPLVRFRSGVWVPHYPSRLYLRGRDTGWGRETLEGAVYLLISGLYDANSPQARWILDDMQDNRLTRTPYSYLIPHFEMQWYGLGGISMQPLLLPSLIPYLDRDEPEVYLWMFYNNFNAVYREEINAICEHPTPILGKSGVVFKPSDEANGTSWMRYMFVYASPDQSLLHLGRAIPRKWFEQNNPFSAHLVATPFGTVSVRYSPDPDSKTITAEVDFQQKIAPRQFLLRFRTPDKQPLQSVRINDQPSSSFDPAKGDVTLTSLSGPIRVTITYE